MKRKVTINLEVENLQYLEEIRANYGPSVSYLLNRLVSEQKQREAAIAAMRQDGPQTGDFIHIPAGMVENQERK